MWAKTNSDTNAPSRRSLVSTNSYMNTSSSLCRVTHLCLTYIWARTKPQRTKPVCCFLKTQQMLMCGRISTLCSQGSRIHSRQCVTGSSTRCLSSKQYLRPFKPGTQSKSGLETWLRGTETRKPNCRLLNRAAILLSHYFKARKQKTKQYRRSVSLCLLRKLKLRTCGCTQR